ncbi:aminopeptidase [Anaerosolibacter carboniphilus]|uniref:Aminopeptidase n=1 Tax=Anaerosolibacter carboniphilus TaxID=1417629 RepID=A0A841KLV4_9FIRM|nr:aminopeptidase [Anaerosolibacter carboniphilus]MBB6214406.1 aminopeptidase [Anaerosolibacter carboniphilus]
MDQALLEKYARLLVKTGINIQKDQILVITSPIECASFARLVAQIAYEEGARDVVMNWRDELFSKIRFMHGPEEIFEEFPSWQQELYISHVRQGAAFLTISASDPELMKDVDPDRMMKAEKARSTALKEYYEKLMANKNVWCVASIPTQSWAMKVFPELMEDEAVEELWNAIFRTVRADQEDPVASWKAHKSNLKKRMEFLNSNQFKLLHYKNALGTDLKIELPEGHLWLGGSEYTPGGVEFIANMPTEEIFTLPKKTGVNGTVVSSMPLNHNGNLIEEFSFTFKDGKIIDFQAKKGYDILKKLLETDEGALYLGEVALVPYDSPISNLNILFYNTLFDENASCHLAIGKAYPVCIKDGENMSQEELIRSGVNDSLTHEDFMIGTADLEIIGTTIDGREIPIFKNGNFAF